MKIANNLPRFISLFLGLSCLSLSAQALDNYKEYKRDSWDFQVGANFFSSDANYPSAGGGSQKLINGNRFQLLDMTFETRYVPQNDWSMFAWGMVSNAESKDSIATRANSSFTEAAVGVDFLSYSENFQIIPEIVGVMPMTELKPTSDTVANTEGVVEVRSRLIVQRDFAASRMYGWLGFNYRGDGRSFLMPWGAGLQFKSSKLRFGAEILGFQSITEDSNNNNITRTAYINSVNAGSYKFYTRDPWLVDSQAYLTWVMNPKFSVQLNGGTTLAGANSAAGYHVGGFIRYSFDMTEGYSQPPETYESYESEVPNYRSNMHQDSNNRNSPSFRESVDDGVDQNLFKPLPTPKPKPKVKPKPRSNPRLEQQKLQQQLDDTEFEIELKADKKKRR